MLLNLVKGIRVNVVITWKKKKKKSIRGIVIKGFYSGILRCPFWNKRWTSSLRARFKVLIKRSRSVGHFCVSLFPLFGVYAVAPGLQCGVPGGVGYVGDYDGLRTARENEEVRSSVRRGEKLSLSLHCPSTALL